MDKKTIDAYNSKAQAYANDWLTQPTPQEIHDIVNKYFLKGGATADVGSGSGRDTHWLNTNNYPCAGFDASEALLTEACKQFPNYDFKYAALPTLVEIEDGAFHNVLCETVLMHLPKATHLSALENLFRITKKSGVLGISWRHPINTAEDSRENDGRLYERIDRQEFILLAKSFGGVCLFEKTTVSASSGKTIDQVVFSKS